MSLTRWGCRSEAKMFCEGNPARSIPAIKASAMFPAPMNPTVVFIVVEFSEPLRKVQLQGGSFARPSKAGSSLKSSGDTALPLINPIWNRRWGWSGGEQDVPPDVSDHLALQV